MIRAIKGAALIVKGTMAAVVPMEEPTMIRVKGMMATIKMIKGVDEAYLGNENGDFLKIVEEINPDIIAIGADQRHDITKLQKAINKRGLKAKVERVKAYHNAELDSSCKIIKKIKKMDFKGKINDNCD